MVVFNVSSQSVASVTSHTGLDDRPDDDDDNDSYWTTDLPHTAQYIK